MCAKKPKILRIFGSDSFQCFWTWFNCIKIAGYGHFGTQICMNCKFQVTIANLRRCKIGYSCKLMEARAFLGLNVRNFRLFLIPSFFLCRVGLELRFKKLPSILDKDKFFEINFIGSAYKLSENFLAHLLNFTNFLKKFFKDQNGSKFARGLFWPTLQFKEKFRRQKKSKHSLFSWKFSDVVRKSVRTYL